MQIRFTSAQPGNLRSIVSPSTLITLVLMSPSSRTPSCAVAGRAGAMAAIRTWEQLVPSYNSL